MPVDKSPKIIATTAVTLWLLLSIYLGAGGITKLENNNLLKKTLADTDTTQVVYKGINFKNKNELIVTLEQEQMSIIFPWLDSVPSFLAYLITACAFGMLGGVINLILQIFREGKNVEEVNYFSLPILSCLSGIVVLGLSFVLPTVLFKEGAEIKPTGLMFLCLFTGLFAKQFYSGVEKIFTKVFSFNK
jgi:hypothetical protein